MEPSGSSRIVTRRVPVRDMPNGVPAVWVLGDPPQLFVSDEVPEDIVAHLLDVMEAS
jgi:hypothetical protein